MGDRNWRRGYKIIIGGNPYLVGNSNLILCQKFMNENTHKKCRMSGCRLVMSLVGSISTIYSYYSPPHVSRLNFDNFGAKRRLRRL